MFSTDPSRETLVEAADGSTRNPDRVLAENFGALYLVDAIEEFSEADIARLFLSVQDYGAVIVRPNQVSAADTYEAFGDRFAPMMLHLDRQGIPQFSLEGCSKISVLKHNTASLKASYGAQLFHHDGWGHAPIDPSLSILMAAAMPVEGGSTFIADARAAYDWLSKGLKELVETLTVVSEMAPEHITAEAGEGRSRSAEFEHALVRTNPVSGRKSLIISNRTVRIKGWHRSESQPLLSFLHQHATQAQLCLRHMWKTGDILLWDDRWVKHAGAKDVLAASERELWRLTATADMRTGKFIENPMSLMK